MDILLATSNLQKIREFKELFRPLRQFQLLSLNAFSDYEPPEEIGLTFRENAALKALYAAKRSGLPTLADDSGLVVPALRGDPGVQSRYYAGPLATDTENRQKLLQNMLGMESFQRAAYFECCLALVTPQGTLKYFEGTCEGFISEEPRGRNGFGYDPIFIKHDYQKTFAELDEHIKNHISHRGKAFERLTRYLESLKEQ